MSNWLFLSAVGTGQFISDCLGSCLEYPLSERIIAERSRVGSSSFAFKAPVSVLHWDLREIDVRDPPRTRRGTCRMPLAAHCDISKSRVK